MLCIRTRKVACLHVGWVGSLASGSRVFHVALLRQLLLAIHLPLVLCSAFYTMSTTPRSASAMRADRFCQQLQLHTGDSVCLTCTLTAETRTSKGLNLTPPSLYIVNVPLTPLQLTV